MKGENSGLSEGIQIIREDWESAGDYSDALNCPMCQALKRITGKRISFSFDNFNEVGEGRTVRIKNRFMYPEYLIAKERYDRGEEILFITSINFIKWNDQK